MVAFLEIKKAYIVGFFFWPRFSIFYGEPKATLLYQIKPFYTIIKKQMTKKDLYVFRLTASNLRTNFLNFGVASFPASQLRK